ncbi:5736_t:CDS:1, partial [Funneliformis caledonium]
DKENDEKNDENDEEDDNNYDNNNNIKASHKPAWLGLPLAQAEPLFFGSAQLRLWRSIDKQSQVKPACKSARSACIYI